MKKAKVKLKKYPLGGNTPQEEQLLYEQQKANSANMIQSGAEKVPVYGQFAALGKGLSEQGANIVGKDTALGQGIINGRPDQALAQLGTDFKQGNFGSATANIMTGGSSEFFKPLIGLDNDPTTKDKLFQYKMGGKKICADGGIINANLEKKENTLNPDGSTNQYNAPPHSAGGVDTHLDPNTLIFSDRLKLGKKTFAELNKANNTSKEDKILEDNKQAKLKRITADLMKQAKIKQSLALFEVQEGLKAEKVNKYAKRIGVDGSKFSYGGIKKYGPGGMSEDDDLLNGFTDFQNSNNTRGRNEYNNIMTNYNAYTPEDQAYLRGENPYDNTVPTSKGMGDNTSESGSGTNWGALALQGASLLAQNAGNIYDLKRAKNVDKETYNRVAPTYLDPTEDLNYNTTQSRKAIQDIQNVSGGNASTYIGSRTAINNASVMNNNRINMAYKNANAGINNQSKYYNAEVGDKETIANLMNQAQSRNLKSNAYANIGHSVGQTATGMYTDQKMEQKDRDFMNIIATRYPEVINDPALQDYFKKYK